jgi:type I restriction enzyme S subunit
MTLEAFIEKFALFADTPDAVAKIRALLVHYGVSGKLAFNDPNERPVQIPLSGLACNGIERPSNWRSGILGDVFTFEYGDNLPAPKRSETGEYPVYGSNGIVGTHDTYLTKKPAIIVGRKGSAGALNIANGPSWTTDVAYFVCPPHDVDLRFSYYLFSTLGLDELGKGIKPGLSRKEVYVLPIALPPLAEQKRIVAKLDELMAFCDRLEEQQHERETRHTALVRASLARFAEAPTPANLDYLFHKSYAIPPADLRKSILTLAVQGKLVPQDPNNEPTETPSPSCVVSPKDAEETPFELPDNWRWMKLGQLSVLINGDRSKNYPNKAEYVREGVAWINTGHIEPDGTLSVESMHYITRKKFQSLRSGKVHVGDLVYCLRGATLGKTAIITQFEEGAVASSLVIIRFSPLVDPNYAYRFLTSPLGRDQIYEFDNGSAQPNLSANNVKKYWIPIPPLAEQRRIAAKVAELMALVDALETQLATARTTAENLLAATVVELTANTKEPKINKAGPAFPEMDQKSLVRIP